MQTGNFCYRPVTFLNSRSGGPEKFSSKLHTLCMDNKEQSPENQKNI